MFVRWQCAHHYGMPSSRLISRMDLKVLRTMGAWIEIRNFNIEITMTRVAPRKGAWIEIMRIRGGDDDENNDGDVP